MDVPKKATSAKKDFIARFESRIPGFATLKEDATVSRAAKTLGARGAKQGGQARAKRMSAKARSASARKAAMARWHGGAK